MKAKFRIDINADIGEGLPNDEDILKFVSSCNIACGGHYGNKNTILKTLQLSKKYNVKVGAHPSYPDIQNFGRQSIRISSSDLIQLLESQLSLFDDCSKAIKVNWFHIKFHGALYNDLKSNLKLSESIVKYLVSHYNNKLLFVPPNSAIQYFAKKYNLEYKVEGFIDRLYDSDLNLVPRTYSGAVINHPNQATTQLLKMVLENQLVTIDQNNLEVNFETYCIHGDNPAVLKIISKLEKSLKQNKIEVI